MIVHTKVISFPASQIERLSINQYNTAAAEMGLLSAPNRLGESVVVVNGILPLNEALSRIIT